MIAADFFASLKSVDDFHRLLEEEHAQSEPLKQPFGLIRIEATGVQGVRELLSVYALVAGAIRQTDRVVSVGGTGLAVLLREGDAELVEEIGRRVRSAVLYGGWGVRLGCACVRAGQGGHWREAWQLAGALLVADGAVPAAA